MPSTLVTAQRELFSILSEFFERATGDTYVRFAAKGMFGTQIRSRAHELAGRGEDAFRWAEGALREYYSRERLAAFSASKRLGGSKFVLGGSSRLPLSAVDSVRRMLLYADTILIPDPVLPWLETTREEERFRHVLLLESVFNVLHLEPLVKADLPYPAVIVFPSWEKSLEGNDDATKDGINGLFLSFLAATTGFEFDTLQAASQFAHDNPGPVLQAIDDAQVFVAPGEGRPGDVRRHVDAYKRHLGQWRSADWLEKMLSLPDDVLILNGLLERIGPQYHLLENSAELYAHPILTVEEQWFYFKMIAQLFRDDHQGQGHVSASTDIASALNTEGLHWLGNVDMPDLVRLRQENENERFRRRLDEQLAALHRAGVEDLDRVAGEVTRAIAALLAEHDTEARRIAERYKAKHVETNVLAWTTLAVSLFPALAPFATALAPAALVAKYGMDKTREIGETRAVGRSLLGVLAKARDRN